MGPKRKAVTPAHSPNKRAATTSTRQTRASVGAIAHKQTVVAEGRSSSGEEEDRPPVQSNRKAPAKKQAVVDSSADNEYSKLFDISPISFVDSVGNAFGDFVCDAVDMLERKLKLIPALSSRHKQIEESCDQLLEFVLQHVDLNVDKFELYVLDSILCVPPGVHVDPSTDSTTKLEMDTAEAELVALKRQLLEKTRQHTRLLRQQKAMQAYVLFVTRAMQVASQICDSLRGDELATLREHSTELQALSDHVRAESRKLINKATTQDRYREASATLETDNLGALHTRLQGDAS